MSDARFYFNICLVGVPILAVCVYVVVKQWKHNSAINEKLSELSDRSRLCAPEQVESVLLEAIDLARQCNDSYQSMRVTGLIQCLMGRECETRKRKIKQ